MSLSPCIGKKVRNIGQGKPVFKHVFPCVGMYVNEEGQM